MKNKRIAILLTCHNRKEITLSCLAHLINQDTIDDFSLQVYLVDDGSTDGTGEAIKKKYPEVDLLHGDGSLFWNGGMRFAFSEAMQKGFDYYLWINDDIVLSSNALKKLLITSREIEEKTKKDGIVVGSLCDPASQTVAYGGFVRKNLRKPMSFELVEPSPIEPLPCDTMNGNCILIPATISSVIGNLSSIYTHAMGDQDYGFRAKQKGFSIWVAPGFVGICSRNPLPAWKNPKVNLVDRLRSLHSPKGLPPIEWFTFVRSHAGIKWGVLYFILLYFKVIFPNFFVDSTLK